jgi:hypothetical protein
LKIERQPTPQSTTIGIRTRIRIPATTTMADNHKLSRDPYKGDKAAMILFALARLGYINKEWTPTKFFNAHQPFFHNRKIINNASFKSAYTNLKNKGMEKSKVQ